MKPGHDTIGVGVGVLIFDDAGQVFLARRGEAARNEQGTWEFPGGRIEFGERMQDAIRREILEEYGITITITAELGAFDHILENEHWVSITFIGRYESGTPAILEPEKCNAIGWFALDQLPEPLSLVSKDNLAVYVSKVGEMGSNG